MPLIHYINSNRRLALLLFSIPLLLSVPLIGNFTSSSVNWSLPDFVMAGFLLLMLVSGIEFVLRTYKHRSIRLLWMTIFILAVALLWIEMAVGIFNSPIAGN